MLDKEDLQAIQALIDASEKRMTHQMKVLLDAEVTPKFNLLADGQAGIVERLDRLEEQVADIQSTLAVNQAVIRQHSKDIRDLKKAQ